MSLVIMSLNAGCSDSTKDVHWQSLLLSSVHEVNVLTNMLIYVW